MLYIPEVWLTQQGQEEHYDRPCGEYTYTLNNNSGEFQECKTESSNNVSVSS